MEKEKRKVPLFMDQCPARTQDLPTFNSTKVVYFSANCTSKIQPLDLSDISCVKVHYRKTLTRRLLAASETKAENEYEEQENESENCENDINEEDWHTVSDGLATCIFDEFVDANENLITAQLLEIGDIATEINGGEEDEEEDNDDEEDVAKVPPTHTLA
ncbi:hypothetical protein AVEN_244448-1 [Araneus ventricosus]|uniref:DDE-1 domain-containing protein n=1 Tax=Araneus ventricosus TaxID=182803 RepID=A0A4Y2U5X2_ARAVE|nr:hypothetical protein AVEN_244448-1 [Araneus ventricosus]